MALADFFRFPPAGVEPSDNEDARTEAHFGERVVTAVAVSTAVLVVALIAVLMGTVGP